MKVAITDACIFIDIYDLQLNHSFSRLDIEIHTSKDVFNELFHEHQQVLKAFVKNGKLITHTISGENREEIRCCAYPNSLSINDKTVLYLAEKFDAVVLSSDKVVRHTARIRRIEYHGMLWIFDRLLESAIITHTEAAEKLKRLIKTNIVYQNNIELNVELEKRLKKWASHV